MNTKVPAYQRPKHYMIIVIRCLNSNMPKILDTFVLNLRKKLNIPEDALIIGRCGGLETFNVEFAKNATAGAQTSPKLHYSILSPT